MNVTDYLRNIYKGPFADYLSTSNSIGGVLKDQSSLVNILLKLEVNLMQILQKYKKPIHAQEEDIFLEPIAKQIGIIKDHTKENDDYHNLTYVANVIDIFLWMKETDMNKFVERFSDFIILYKNEMNQTNFSFEFTPCLEAWIKTLEEFSEFILTFFQHGLVWLGTEKLPAQAVLGDKQEFRNFDRTALFNDINQGENIIRMLRHRENSPHSSMN
ncbi:uncharacterized protein LOC130441036 [Diorhabda sublineata]|uniref:uncharacterized protein LOC130441036 n=1 Tax=Diorhabda sublineata TaxID=1163346 RepID=UPI0024E12B37|nr:uncharacterized protein LOC130441036 [Diorhabda sublineata]